MNDASSRTLRHAPPLHGGGHLGSRLRRGTVLASLLTAASCGTKKAPAPEPVTHSIDAYAVRDLGLGRCFAIAGDGAILGFVEPPLDRGQTDAGTVTQTGPFLLTPDGKGNYAQTFLAKRDPGDDYSVVNHIQGTRLSGYTQGPQHTEAVVYDRLTSAWLTLGALQPGDMTQATGLTTDGWVAGFDRTFPEDAAPFNHAVLYPPQGGIVDVGPLVTKALGGQPSVTTAINEAGLVVGVGVTSNDVQHAFAYDRVTGVVTDLGTLGGTDSQAMAVNNSGAIAGASETQAGKQHAFVRAAGAIALQDLGTLGGETSWAQAINDDGLVLGQSEIASGETHPFVAAKIGDTWKLHDLSADDRGAHVSPSVTSMDGKGEIVGAGPPKGEASMHCLLWSAK